MNTRFIGFLIAILTSVAVVNAADDKARAAPLRVVIAYGPGEKQLKAFGHYLEGIGPSRHISAFTDLREPIDERVPDFHATILQRMGLDHERLSMRHAGVEVSPTGVEHARAVKENMA